MTIPGGFTALDVLASADMNLLPGGQVGYAQITTSQLLITSVVDLAGLTVTWSADSSRMYRTSWYFAASSSVANDVASVRCTNSANTQIGITTTGLLSTTYNYVYTGSVIETGLSGSTTRKLRALRTDGTGNIAINANTDAPCYIVVDDLGPA